MTIGKFMYECAFFLWMMLCIGGIACLIYMVMAQVDELHKNP